MKFINLTKNDKLKLLKSIENSKITIINKNLKELLKSKNIKSLRKFQEINDLFNFLYPPTQQNIYEILYDNVINNKKLNEKSTYDYKNFLKRMKDYNGGFNPEEITKYIKNNYTQASAIKVLNVIVNYFQNNKEQHETFYKIRHTFYKDYHNTDKGLVFNNNTKDDYNKIIKNMNDNIYKLFFVLFVNYPNLRLQDYFNISLNEKDDNFITKDYKKIIFNKLVKSDTTKKITIDLTPEHQELFKKILTDFKYEYLHTNIKLDSFKKHINRMSKKLFNVKSISLFRRLAYQENKEQYKQLQNISHNQNHTIQNSINYYV